MASSQRLSFTDEEILEELRKLGYDEVPQNVFQMMKEDILKLAEQVESDSSYLESSNSNASNSSVPISRSNLSSARNENCQTFQNAKKTIFEDEKFCSEEPVRNRRPIASRVFDNGNDTSASNDSSTTSDECTKNGNDMIYRREEDTNNQIKISSNSSGSLKTIKRKVMRHRNGQTVITEQLLPITNLESPHEIEGCVQSNESLSSDEFSFQSSGSSGCSTRPVSTVFPSNRSTRSLSSTRSAPPRLSIPRRKKSDPVAMYNYYRKFWENFKPPGEKTHDKLRWAVRDKMLDYN